MTEQKGARFLDYDCDKGLWQFGALAGNVSESDSIFHSQCAVDMMRHSFTCAKALITFETPDNRECARKVSGRGHHRE